MSMTIPRAAGFLTGQYHFRLANLGGKAFFDTLQLQQMLVRSRRRGEVLPSRS